MADVLEPAVMEQNTFQSSPEQIQEANQNAGPTDGPVSVSTIETSGPAPAISSEVYTGPEGLPSSILGESEGAIGTIVASTNPQIGVGQAAGSYLQSLGLNEIPILNLNLQGYPSGQETGAEEVQHLTDSGAATPIQTVEVYGQDISQGILHPDVSLQTQNIGGYSVPLPEVGVVTPQEALVAVPVGYVLGAGLGLAGSLGAAAAYTGGTILANAPIVGGVIGSAGEAIVGVGTPIIEGLAPYAPAALEAAQVGFTVGLPAYAASQQNQALLNQGYPVTIAGREAASSLAGNLLITQAISQGSISGAQNPYLPRFGQVLEPMGTIPAGSERVLAESGLPQTELFSAEELAGNAPYPVKAAYSGLYLPGDFGTAQPLVGVSAEGKLLYGFPSPEQLPSLAYTAAPLALGNSQEAEALNLESLVRPSNDLQTSILTRSGFASEMGFSPQAQDALVNLNAAAKTLYNNPLDLQSGLPGETRGAGVAAQVTDEAIREFNAQHPLLEASGYGTYYSSNPYLSSYRAALAIPSDQDIIVNTKSPLLSLIGGSVLPEQLNPSEAAASLGETVAGRVNLLSDTLSSIPEVGGSTSFVQASTSASELGVSGNLGGEQVKIADIHAAGEGEQIPEEAFGKSLSQGDTSIEGVPTGSVEQQSIRKLGGSIAQGFENPESGYIELQPSSRRIKDIASALTLAGQETEQLGGTTPEALQFQEQTQGIQAYFANRDFPVTASELSTTQVNIFAETEPFAAGAVLPVLSSPTEQVSLAAASPGGYLGFNSPSPSGSSSSSNNLPYSQSTTSNSISRALSLSSGGSSGSASSLLPSSQPPSSSSSGSPSPSSPSPSGSGSGSGSPGYGLGGYGIGSGIPGAGLPGLGPGVNGPGINLPEVSYNRRSRYAPSLTAIIFGIKGKVSQIAIDSGISIRPIVGKTPKFKFKEPKGVKVR